MSAPSVEELGRVPLFAALDARALEGLAQRLSVRSFEAGERLFGVGDASQEILIVLDGEIELFRHDGEGRRRRLGRRGPSDWFGEVGLIAIKSRAIEAWSQTRARVLVLPARELLELYRRDMRAYALVTMNLARELARKLESVEERWVDGRAPLEDLT
ncbi:MAG: cyclic nucleotide-binding domain-containing protein [Deltaproteobacteria bacterium]|nr:cyclic nucleotide-binding domain-containing protein [Deltaproteobacteria bacterium]